MSPGIIALISALGGVFISQVANTIISLTSKRYEYQSVDTFEAKDPSALASLG